MAEKGFKRKLTAILSADVIGYSRLMRDSEEATVRDIAARRVLITEIVQQHNGRVVDSTGDNILAEFASVVDAVNGAIKVQDEIKKSNTATPEDRRMEFRIGINLGDVIEEEDRIYGDGVNIAARASVWHTRSRRDKMNCRRITVRNRLFWFAVVPRTGQWNGSLNRLTPRFNMVQVSSKTASRVSHFPVLFFILLLDDLFLPTLLAFISSSFKLLENKKPQVQGSRLRLKGFGAPAGFNSKQRDLAGIIVRINYKHID